MKKLTAREQRNLRAMLVEATDSQRELMSPWVAKDVRRRAEMWIRRYESLYRRIVEAMVKP